MYVQEKDLRVIAHNFMLCNEQIRLLYCGTQFKCIEFGGLSGECPEMVYHLIDEVGTLSYTHRQEIIDLTMPAEHCLHSTC